MVWFTCDNCGDSIKKPSLQKHIYSCGSHSFTCVDCCQTFDQNTAKQHNICVTEHEKYALGATKPGGFAANGYHKDGNQQKQQNGPAEPSGLEFLSTRAPWKCSICNVNCTSQDTLMSHAAGAKHKRRARAALNAKAGGDQAAQPAPQQPAGQQQEAQQGTAQPATQEAAANGSSKQQHAALADRTKFDALVGVVKKKLSKKGKVGPKKLKQLTVKQLGVSEDDLSKELIADIRQQLVQAGVAKVDGKKLLPA